MDMERCKKCVLPVSSVAVNEQGVCQLCASYHEKTDWKKLEADLQNIVQNLKKSKHGKYDCLVPLTGGKDSSFVLHYTRNVCGLTPLAFTWDNGLIRDLAQENIKSAVKKLGLDHEVVAYDPEHWKRAMRASLRDVKRVCWCPVFVYSSAIPVAVKHKIPVIFTGFSEGQRGIDHTFTIPDKEKNLEDIKTYYRVWEAVFGKCISAYENEEMTAKIMDTLFGRLGDYLKTHKDPADYPVVIPLSNYVSWFKRGELVQTLEQNLGWKRPADSFVHSSCLIEPIKGYLEFKGKMDEIHHELSYLVRGGFMKREEAMKDLDAMNVNDREPSVMKPFAEFLSMPEDVIRTVIDNDPKWKPFATGVAGKASGKEVRDSVAWMMGNREQLVDYGKK
jgi:hypothetical protein